MWSQPPRWRYRYGWPKMTLRSLIYTYFISMQRYVIFSFVMFVFMMSFTSSLFPSQQMQSPTTRHLQKDCGLTQFLVCPIRRYSSLRVSTTHSNFSTRSINLLVSRARNSQFFSQFTESLSETLTRRSPGRKYFSPLGSPPIIFQFGANSKLLMLEIYCLLIVFFSYMRFFDRLRMYTFLKELRPNKLAGSVSLNSGEMGGRSSSAATQYIFCCSRFKLSMLSRAFSITLQPPRYFRNFSSTRCLMARHPISESLFSEGIFSRAWFRFTLELSRSSSKDKLPTLSVSSRVYIS